MSHEACCAPTRTASGEGVDAGRAPVSLTLAPASAAHGPRHAIEQCVLPGGTYARGDASGDGWYGDGETPVHPVSVGPFSIDATAVTVADFARFVDATGYVTDAEEWGFSAVFHLLLAAPPEALMDPVPGAPWWRGVRGADWAHPYGPDSGVDGLADHPAVHLSWNDAQAYCRWVGRRLPTEAEWEYASRGGVESARYPWGDELIPDSGEHCNIWQGRFPDVNTRADGWLATAPVRSYAPNGFGLWQTVGNVWEWCEDWFSPTAYRTARREDPRGPVDGAVKVMRGGSYLCHDSYCNRYRNAARSSNTPDSSMGNAGFRTVAS